MNVFEVNQYITLKLENGMTNIYINRVLFKQCKYLLLKNLKEQNRYIEFIFKQEPSEEILQNIAKALLEFLEFQE